MSAGGFEFTLTVFVAVGRVRVVEDVLLVHHSSQHLSKASGGSSSRRRRG